MNKLTSGQIDDAIAAELQGMMTKGHFVALAKIIEKHFQNPKGRGKHFRLAIDSKICNSSGEVIGRTPIAELITVEMESKSSAKIIVELIRRFKQGEITTKEFRKTLLRLKARNKMGVAFAVMTHLSPLIKNVCPRCKGSGVEFQRQHP